jgi:hypothetical protein
MDPMGFLIGDILAAIMGWLSQPVRYWKHLAVTLLFFAGIVLLFFALVIDQTTPSNRELDSEFYICLILGTLSFGSAVVALIVAIIRGFLAQRAISNVRTLGPSDARQFVDELRKSPEITEKTGPLVGVNWRGADLHGINLSDFNLDGVALNAANLNNTRFTGANLHMARLQGANLSGADLYHACLRSARLEKANLSHADLRRADLQYARLNGADLRESDLSKADLSAADLTGVLLRDASLTGAKFDEFTTLPDGRKWTPDTDLARYGVGPKSDRKPKSKIKLKRGPDDRYDAGADGDECYDEPEPPAWVAREGRTLRVISKRYPPA